MQSVKIDDAWLHVAADLAAEGRNAILVCAREGGFARRAYSWGDREIDGWPRRQAPEALAGLIRAFLK